MKIKRAGVFYNLTGEELMMAFLEQQHIFNVGNIRENMEYHLDPDEFERLKDNPEFLNEAANLFQKHLDNDMSFDQAIEKAVTTVADKYIS